MKNSLLMIAVLIFCAFSSQAQARYDLIIVIDDEVVSNVLNPHIIAKDIIKNIDIPVQYYPGALILNAKDYEFLLKKVDTFSLVFDYIFYSQRGKQNVKSYEITMGKNWFERPYLIVKIHNTNNLIIKKSPYSDK